MNKPLTSALNMLYLTILSVCLLAATCQAKATQKPWYHPEDAEQHFEEFIATYNKQYKDESEKNMRFLIFKEKLMNINEKNSKGHAEYGITKFADWTKEEFKQFSHGLLPQVHDMALCTDLSGYAKDEPAPESLDWRDKEKVTAVKSQGRCGSCWAFSTVGNLEGQYAIKHNQLVEFSPQQLVDCDRNDYGCFGGVMSNAIMWLSQNGGALTEQDYPYDGRVNICEADQSKAVVKVTGCNQYFIQHEDELKQILADVGPLAVGIDATELFDYSNGIITCDPGDKFIDHAVLLVGYGKEDDKPYWLLKNSWDTSFGEEGYFRFEMYKNTCNMTGMIISAVVA